MKSFKLLFKEFSAADKMFHSLVSDMLSVLPTADSPQKDYSLILSGGRSPVYLHKLLVEQSSDFNIAWNNIFFFFSDERCVPPDDGLSNYAMAAQTLFNPLKIQPANIFRMEGELTPDSAADQYHQQIDNFFQGTPYFDLALLGMGTDGHTASLFPQSTALEIQDSFAVSTGPGPEGRHRVSLTYRSLNMSKRAWVMVTGREKKKTLDKALKSVSHFRDFPIKGIQPLEELIFYISP
jgi:6-phosphogluconolactonase